MLPIRLTRNRLHRTTSPVDSSLQAYSPICVPSVSSPAQSRSDTSQNDRKTKQNEPKNRSIKRTLAPLVFLLPLLLSAWQSWGGKASTFEAGKGSFMLDGKPFVIKAAELHYPRIPRDYWENRIQLCKALGMKTICLYVFWNAHEEGARQVRFHRQQ